MIFRRSDSRNVFLVQVLLLVAQSLFAYQGVVASPAT